LHALDAGAESIVVGCGDSGVNDGGAGLLEALGALLLDNDGRTIEPTGAGLCRIARLELEGLDRRLAQVDLRAACNPRNVLTGPYGVARLFGPQKGASPDEVETLAAALERWAGVIAHITGRDVRNTPGSGASGGVGAALQGVLGAQLVSRFELLFPYFALDEEIARADLVITAEGGLDYRTARGKIPAEIGERGAAAGKPVIVLAGGLGERPEAVLDHGVCAFFSTVGRPESLREAMERAHDEVALVAEHVLRTFLAGVAFGHGHPGA
jgi:glycerate kinase